MARNAFAWPAVFYIRSENFWHGPLWFFAWLAMAEAWPAKFYAWPAMFHA